MFMVVIHGVSNGSDIIQSPNHLPASYTDVRHWENLIYFIIKTRGPKEPYILTLMFKCTMEQDELDEEYMGIYTNRQMIMDPIYGQSSYNCCLSNAFILKLGHNPKVFLVGIKRATGKEIVEHVIGPAKVIPASHVRAGCAQLPIIIRRLWKVLKSVVEERMERRKVGKRMILVFSVSNRSG